MFCHLFGPWVATCTCRAWGIIKQWKMKEKEIRITLSCQTFEVNRAVLKTIEGFVSSMQHVDLPKPAIDSFRKGLECHDFGVCNLSLKY